MSVLINGADHVMDLIRTHGGRAVVTYTDDNSMGARVRRSEGEE